MRMHNKVNKKIITIICISNVQMDFQNILLFQFILDNYIIIQNTF